jgi:hypothetical protein
VIGLIVGIVRFIEFKNDDPELLFCCVELGSVVDRPELEFGNELPNPKSFPKLPEDMFKDGNIVDKLLLLPDAAGVGLGVEDAPPLDPAFDCFPPDGTPVCGRIPPGGCPRLLPGGIALGETARELLLSADIDTPAEPFSTDMAVSLLTPGLAFCGWVIAFEDAA